METELKILTRYHWRTAITRGLIKHCRQIQPRFCYIYAILLKAINQSVRARFSKRKGSLLAASREDRYNRQQNCEIEPGSWMILENEKLLKPKIRPVIRFLD